MLLNVSSPAASNQPSVRACLICGVMHLAVSFYKNGQVMPYPS